MSVRKINSIKDLQPGMTVRGRGGLLYIVTGNYGNRVTAVRSQDITNIKEWSIVDTEENHSGLNYFKDWEAEYK